MATNLPSSSSPINAATLSSVLHQSWSTPSSPTLSGSVIELPSSNSLPPTLSPSNAANSPSPSSSLGTLTQSSTTSSISALSSLFHTGPTPGLVRTAS
ncbi:hypothetical protein ACSBR1_013321 [Camellia fascicularis]